MNEDTINNPKKIGKKISQSDIPGVSLEQALRVPRAISDNYAKSPTRPLDVATALNMSPKSGPFRRLCGAAIGYGLTEGGSNAPLITITALSKRIVSPIEEGDDQIALREAVLKPTVEKRFLDKYDGSPLPIEKIAYNVLESFGVPTDRTKQIFDLIMHNAGLVGYLKKIKDKTYVDLGGVNHITPSSIKPDETVFEAINTELNPDIGGDEINTPIVVSESNKVQSSRPNAIFLGHGKNKEPLEQLIKILDEYRIPHKEAIYEANAGRPIPTKVAEIMHECGAAILIFTADEKFLDESGNEIWRPSENVIHELGAASVLYDNRIVIFKEDNISLASNFSSIGYINFEKDKLNDKGIELFRELVNFKIVNITVG